MYKEDKVSNEGRDVAHFVLQYATGGDEIDTTNLGKHSFAFKVKSISLLANNSRVRYLF